MAPQHGSRTVDAVLRSALLFCALSGLSGCLVAGYTSQSGFWVWPGSFVITLVLVLLYFLMRHR